MTGNTSNEKIALELVEEFRKERLWYPKTNLKLDNSVNKVWIRQLVLTIWR